MLAAAAVELVSARRRPTGDITPLGQCAQRRRELASQLPVNPGDYVEAVPPMLIQARGLLDPLVKRHAPQHSLVVTGCKEQHP